MPPERDLVKEFGVSRRTLREALRILEQKGLIEIRTGSKGGAFMKRLTTDQVSESLALLIRLKRVSLRELAEFRLDIEGIVARMAAQRATISDIVHLKALLQEAEALLKEEEFDWKAFIDVDRRMHTALAHVARSSVHEAVLKIVHDNIFSYYESYLPRGREIVQENYKDMVEIVECRPISGTPLTRRGLLPAYRVPPPLRAGTSPKTSPTVWCP